MEMNRNNNQHQQFPKYIESLQSTGRYWFSGNEIQQKLGLSSNAIKAALWRLTQQRAICRIRKDFYVIVPPEHRSAGCLPAQWIIEPLMEYLGLPYYIALLSAASTVGAAHQQVMFLQVITTKPLRKIEAGNQRILFYYKPAIDKDWLDTKKTPISSFKLSKPELTAFDLVHYANGFEQLQHAATVIYELKEILNTEKMASLVNDHKVAVTTAQRLGYILEKIIEADFELDDLELAIMKKKPRYIPLVSSKANARYGKNPRWHILIDEELELDEL